MNLSKSLILTSALFAFTAIGSASPITVFNVTGQFTDGSVLGVSFDISNCQIISARAMTISGITRNIHAGPLKRRRLLQWPRLLGRRGPE